MRETREQEWDRHESILEAVLGPRDGSSYSDGLARAQALQWIQDIEMQGFQILPREDEVLSVGEMGYF